MPLIHMVITEVVACSCHFNFVMDFTIYFFVKYLFLIVNWICHPIPAHSNILRAYLGGEPRQPLSGIPWRTTQDIIQYSCRLEGCPCQVQMPDVFLNFQGHASDRDLESRRYGSSVCKYGLWRSSFNKPWLGAC